MTRMHRPSPAERTRHADAISQDPRWIAVQSRDSSRDGQFVYAVTTTGVYCRPSCPSRPARPEHVTFHATPIAAERAGFRACKRCRPEHATADHDQVLVVTRVCRIIETTDPMPPLAELAQAVGLSPSHLHRLFRRITGVTPKGYARAPHADRLAAELRSAGTVTAAIYGAGYPSPSGFYRTAQDALGMTPSAFRAGGSRVAIRYACHPCSLGVVLVATSDRGVCAIFLGDDPAELERDLRIRFPHATLVTADAAFATLMDAVVRSVDAPGTAQELPLDIQGTAFQQRVWQALRTIPCGSTASYSDIALQIGSPTATRAVAGACAANVLAVVIPCHRVVRGTGALSGYRWGVERKRTLLERERGRPVP
jgi:AraC family transcriptional regulator of adaptative response/methylated-DNA-[protein]-cysteine methyltransferase